MVVLGALALSGCATIGGMVGLASEEYVDAQIAAATAPL
jgi:hypothetical protein